jgi:hypothetical protein
MRFVAGFLFVVCLLLVGCSSGPSQRDLAIAYAREDNFTRLCYQSAHETIKRIPDKVTKIYLSRLSDIYGLHDSELFFNRVRPSRWAYAELLDIDVPTGIPGVPGAYEVRYSAIKAQPFADGMDVKYYGVRQQIFEVQSGELIAERENYVWGQDFSRGRTCIGYDWENGNSEFVDRVLGYRYRDKTKSLLVPESYVRARGVGITAAKISLLKDRSEATLPPGAIEDYNKRTITLAGGSKVRMTTFFNQEPVPRLATLRDGNDYVFVLSPGGWQTASPLRKILLIRYDRIGKLIQKVYVQLPLYVDSKDGWGVRQKYVTLEQGVLRIRVYGDIRPLEPRRANIDTYMMQYDFVADIPPRPN